MKKYEESFQISNYESKLAPGDSEDPVSFKPFIWKNSLYLVTDYYAIYRIINNGELANDLKIK